MSSFPTSREKIEVGGEEEEEEEAVEVDVSKYVIEISYLLIFSLQSATKPPVKCK